jgi:cytochrome c heme-lyase
MVLLLEDKAGTCTPLLGMWPVLPVPVHPSSGSGSSGTDRHLSRSNSRRCHMLKVPSIVNGQLCCCRFTHVTACYTKERNLAGHTIHHLQCDEHDADSCAAAAALCCRVSQAFEVVTRPALDSAEAALDRVKMAIYTQFAKYGLPCPITGHSSSDHTESAATAGAAAPASH